MSMILYLHRFPLAEVEQLLQEPEGIVEKLEAAFEVEPVEGQVPEYLDLDKAWHGIHYLLTGSTWEGAVRWCFLLVGGQPVGEEDLGYGPAQALMPEQVREFHLALVGLDVETFASRFDQTKLQADDIYPSIWDRPLEEDDTRGYLCAYYEELRAFVAEAAANDQALITYIS